jgi:TPR repeat protein
MYYHGDGIPQDNKRAVTLFEQAANGGDVQSAANLGMMYEHGMGVDQDDVGAALWYRKAAELGDPHAQLNTSITFYQGKGVAKDRIEAAKWWTIAMSNGQDWEARFRPTIESAEAKLTAEEIEQGRRQAFEWIAAHKVKP